MPTLFEDALLVTLALVEDAVEGDPRESPSRSLSRVLELFTRPVLGLVWGSGLAVALTRA